MPELIYSIGGDNSGLLSATNKAIANIENLTNAVNNANVSLQFQNGISALDKLGQQLLIVQGNASLFGDSIKNQTQTISAYQGALNTLLANGFDPMSTDVQRLKSQIDDLNASIKATPTVTKNRDFTGNEPNSTKEFANSTPINPSGLSGADILIQKLNEDLQNGVISATEFREAIQNIGTSNLSQSIQQTSQAVEQADGYISGLRASLQVLNQQRGAAASIEDLAVLNAEIQETEISLQQATNIGKVGFDAMGNSIKGVSLQSVNGQLFALTNNLFGARQIAKDVVRTFDTSSLSSFARGIGLLAVDFLYYAQNAQFAAGATGVATAAIGTEATVAAGGAISIEALGAAFATLLTPVNLVILGIALLGGGLLAYEKTQKTAAQAAAAHVKALADQKKILDEYISTLSESQQAEAKAADTYADQVAKLNLLYTAVEQQVSAGKDYTKSLTDLQDTFPQFFANLDNANVKTSALTDAFNKATTAFKALGIVQATQTLSTPLYETVASNTVAQSDILPQLNAAKAALDEANAAYAKENQSATASFTGPGQGGASTPAVYLNQLQVAYDALKTKSDAYTASIANANTKLTQLAQVGATFQTQADKLNAPLSGSVEFLQKQLDTLQKIEPFLATQEQRNANIAQQKKLQAEIDADNLKNQVNLVNEAAKQLSIQQQIAKVLAESGADAAKSGLTGYSLQVQDITLQYQKFAVELDTIAAKIKTQSALFSASNGKKGISPTQAGIDTSSLNSARGVLSDNEAKQLSDAQIKDAQQTADAITKINNDFGVKQEVGYNEELQRVKKLYDSIITAAQDGTLTLTQINENYQAALLKAGNNPDLIASAKLNYDAQIQQSNDAQAKILAAKADLLPAIQAIDAKYIEQEQQSYDKIIEIANQAFETLDDGETSRTDKINLEWQKRIISASAYFDRLRDLAKASNLPQSAIDNINQVQSQVNSVLNAADFKAVSVEISKNFADAMQSAVQGFVSDFYNSITSLGTTRQSIDEKYALQLQQQQTAYLSGTSDITAAQNASTVAQINNLKQLELQSTTSFGAIFSTLVSKFNSTFNTSILNSFTKQFTENLGKTLLTPSAKQLSISPEEKSAQNVATLLKDAGTNLADQIKQAGVDFYNSTKGGLLSGVSGGSSVIQGQTAIPSGLGSFAPDADGGISFSNSVNTASDTFQAGSSTAAGNIVAGGLTLQKSTEAAADHLSSKIAGAAAALSLAGGLISGATSPTSKVGQGVGGALQGAGEGALIGSAIPGVGTVAGAVIGGAIGLISGIFSASKAQKELQAQQLAQQQEQTALLKASLAYTSGIIGRDTAQGVVTGISVGSFGQLTATIAGKDLQFILNRNANGR